MFQGVGAGSVGQVTSHLQHAMQLQVPAVCGVVCRGTTAWPVVALHVVAIALVLHPYEQCFSHDQVDLIINPFDTQSVSVCVMTSHVACENSSYLTS